MFLKYWIITFVVSALVTLVGYRTKKNKVIWIGKFSLALTLFVAGFLVVLTTPNLATLTNEFSIRLIIGVILVILALAIEPTVRFKGIRNLVISIVKTIMTFIRHWIAPVICTTLMFFCTTRAYLFADDLPEPIKAIIVIAGILIGLFGGIFITEKLRLWPKKDAS